MPNSPYSADGGNLYRETTLQIVAGLTALDGSGLTVPVVVDSSGSLQTAATQASVTPHFIGKTAGQTQVIPIGAIGANVQILTGTGTLGGLAVAAGDYWYEPNKLAATVTLVLDTPGTARVYYGT